MRKFAQGLLALLVLALALVEVHAQDQFTSTKSRLNDVYIFSTNALAEELVSLPLLPLPTSDHRWPTSIEGRPPDGIGFGTLSGSATAGGLGPTFQPIAGATLVLRRAGDVVATTTTDAQGQFSISQVARGRYVLELGQPGVVLASIESHVTDGIESRELFFQDLRTNQFFAFKPAVRIGLADPQLDVTSDGKVDLDDLEYAEACLGVDPLQNPACAPADVNGDGIIDDQDLGLIRGNFDMFCLGVPGLYGAPVSRGGSQALIAGDFPLISNDGGLTEVTVDVDPANPRQVLFQVMSDRGTASPPPPLMGDLSFTENPDDLTSGAVNLNTGRFTGRMTLRVSGPGGNENAPMEGVFEAGQIVFAPKGFNLYNAFVTGTLPPDFPVFAGAPYSMSKCQSNKPDVSCQKETVTVIKHPECALGFQCVTDGAACVLNGRQGLTCTTVFKGNPQLLTCDCVCK